MKIDINGIKNNVKTNLNRGKTQLDKAYNILASVSVPSDFYLKGQIKNCPSKINQIKSSIKSLDKWLDKLVDQFNATENKNNATINSLLNSMGGFGFSSSSKGKKSDKKTKDMTAKQKQEKENIKKMHELSKQKMNEKLKADEEISNKTRATITNAFFAFGKGVGKFGESAVDFFATLAPYYSESVLKSDSDLSDEEIEKEIKKMKDKTMSFVAEEHVENAFYDFYKNNKFGKWLDKHAIEPMKSDGSAYKVVEEVGYVSAIAATSAFTGGGAAAGAGVATTSGMGRYTEEHWAKSRDSSWEGMERMYQKGEITKAQLDTFEQIRDLSDKEWKQLESNHEQLTDEQYEFIKQIREMPNEWKTDENRINGILYGLANGAWEGIQWFVGGKLGDISIGTSKLGNSAARVSVDTVFNAADTPYRTTVEALTSDKTWQEAWQEQGGWTSVLMNTAVGFIGSAGGEVFDIKMGERGNSVDSKIKQNIKEIPDIGKSNIKKDIWKDYKNGVLDADSFRQCSPQELVEAFNAKYPETLVDGKRMLQTPTQIAEYFNDPYGFVANKIFPNFTEEEKKIFTQEMRSIRDPNELIEKCYQHLNSEDKNTLIKLLNNQKKLSQTDEELIRSFSKFTGPVYSSYLRNQPVNFQGALFDAPNNRILTPNGQNMGGFEDYIQGAYNRMELLRDKVDILDDISRLDHIIENSPPLQESVVVTRNVDMLFKDGDNLLTFDIGTKFNDKAILSTSADGGNNSFSNRKIKLEIEVPAGEKIAYIEPNVAFKNGTGYHQQEILLPRNSTYEIIDVPAYRELDNGEMQTYIRARLVPSEKSVVKLNNLENISSSNIATDYYRNTGIKPSQKQIDIKDMMQELKDKRLLTEFEREVNDLKNSGFYNSTDRLPEHGIEHVQDVLLNALYIGEKEGLDNNELRILMEASKFHDCTRTDVGAKHGAESAIKSEYYLSLGYNEEEVKMMQAAMEYHSIQDSEEELLKIFNQYNIDSEYRETAKKIANILKDADAIDRTRFPGNLDERYLRTDTAKTMIEASYQLQELKGIEYLNKNLNNWSQSTKDVVKTLQDSGVSNYEISFWIRNQPTDKGAMPVWINLNNKIQSILNFK